MRVDVSGFKSRSALQFKRNSGRFLFASSESEFGVMVLCERRLPPDESDFIRLLALVQSTRDELVKTLAALIFKGLLPAAQNSTSATCAIHLLPSN